MTFRTRTPVALPALAAALFVVNVSASSAWAQANAGAQTDTGQTAAPAVENLTHPRHVDVEVGVGAHIAIKHDAPLDDDVYADIGLAAPITDHFDAEARAGYLSGGRNEGGGGRPQGDSKNAWLLDVGARYYPLSSPDAPVRFFIFADAVAMIDYHHGDDCALGMSVGPGVRMRAGKQSGLLVRLPFTFDVEHDSPDIPDKNSGRESIILPSLSYFYQF